MIMILITIGKEIQVSFDRKERILKQGGKKKCRIGLISTVQ